MRSKRCAVQNQGITLNQGITKRPYIFIFAKFSYRQINPLMKNFKTKKKYLDHLDNFNSPLPLQPPL